MSSDLVPIDRPVDVETPESMGITTRKVSPLADLQLKFVDSLDSALELKRWLGERRDTPIGLDTETTGLSPEKDQLRLVQFGDESTGWAVPWPMWGGLIQEVLHQWDGGWVLHNRPFDARFFAVHTDWEFPWHDSDDTMTIGGLIDPLRPKGLKTMAARYVDPTATQGEKLLHDGMKKQGWTWGTVPYSFAPYWVYGALDPVLAVHLWKWGHGKVTASCPEAYQLELGAQRVCTNMMLAGLKVDQGYVRAESARLREFSAEARGWLKARHGITSPMSAVQIARALEALGIEITEFTPTNQPKISKEILTAYRDTHPDQFVRDLARYVLAIRHADKLTGTYLDNFLELMDGNGRLHASINSFATRTGRMSSSDPNLQNLPRDDKVVRGAFVPEDGFAFIGCDLDQVEARLTAHFTQDAGLIQAFLDADQLGTDFFCGIASGIFGEPIVKGDVRRQFTKNVVYGSIYGAGAVKMAQTAGVPVAQMRPVKEAFDLKYPGIKRLTNEIIDAARAYNPPMTFSPLGRPLVADHERAYTQLLNALIQGHAAEYFKMRLVDLDAAGYGPYMRLPIHDEIILEVPAADADLHRHEVERLMSDRENYRVPITAGGKVMTERWAK